MVNTEEPSGLQVKSSSRSSGTSQKSKPRNENKQTVEQQRLKQALCKQSKKRRKGRHVMRCIVSFVAQLYIRVNAQSSSISDINICSR